MPTESGLSVDQKHARAGQSCLEPGRESRRPAPNHADIRMHMLDFGFCLRRGIHVDLTESGDAPCRGFEQPPLPWFVKPLVIKADRETAVEFVDNPQRVESERR